MKILIILSPGFEETEAITVIDILRRAKLSVTTASLTPNQTVLGSHQIPVIADLSLIEVMNGDVMTYDAIVLPGGMRGVENMLNDSRILTLVKDFHATNKVVAAVCAAPLILEKAGILAGHSYTCHPCVFDRIHSEGRLECPAITDANLVTGRSAGCALAWAIELTKKLVGSDDAIRTGLAIL